MYVSSSDSTLPLATLVVWLPQKYDGTSREQQNKNPRQGIQNQNRVFVRAALVAVHQLFRSRQSTERFENDKVSDAERQVKQLYFMFVCHLSSHQKYGGRLEENEEEVGNLLQLSS